MDLGDDEHAGLNEARKAIDLIAQYRSPADSRAFAIWQTYARGADRALCDAVDAFIAQKQSLNHDDIEFLHRAYIEEPRAGEKPQQLAEALIKEVSRILEAVELATGSAARFGESLKQMSNRLESEIDPASLQQMIRNLSDITQQTIADNETMSLSLRAARVELDTTRDTLAVVRSQSLTDDLTTLSNRRHFDVMIASHLNAVRAGQTKLVLLMIDVDHFKRFNDQYGHQTGDQVLRLVAQTVKKHMPANATAARYGGEEIAILLPDQELFQAMRLAETLRTELRGRNLVKRASGESLGRVTISSGVACARSRDTAAALIARADQCLAAAKAAGRDRSMSEEDLPAEPKAKRKAS